MPKSIRDEPLKAHLIYFHIHGISVKHVYTNLKMFQAVRSVESWKIVVLNKAYLIV